MIFAKDEQGFIEQDIQRIEHMLRYALIIEDTGDNNVVQIGKTVTFIELPGDEEESYQIVGSRMHLTAKSQTNHLWLKH